MRMLCTLAVTAALASCATNMKPAHRLLHTEENVAKCASWGGRPTGNSMLTIVCMWPSTDAGNACRDNSQCQGICEVPESAYRMPGLSADVHFPGVVIASTRKMAPATGTPMTEVCAAWRAHGKVTNCKSYVADGVVAETVCFD